MKRVRLDVVWDMVWDRASRKFSLTNIAVEDSLAEKLSVSQ